MGTTDQIQIMLVQKLRHHLRAKGKWYTSVVLSPAQNILVWIRPEQITQQTLVGHISGAHDASNLLHGLKVRWQSYMNSKKSTNHHIDIENTLYTWVKPTSAATQDSITQGQKKKKESWSQSVLWTCCINLNHSGVIENVFIKKKKKIKFCFLKMLVLS